MKNFKKTFQIVCICLTFMLPAAASLRKWSEMVSHTVPVDKMLKPVSDSFSFNNETQFDIPELELSFFYKTSRALDTTFIHQYFNRYSINKYNINGVLTPLNYSPSSKYLIEGQICDSSLDYGKPCTTKLVIHESPAYAIKLSYLDDSSNVVPMPPIYQVLYIYVKKIFIDTSKFSSVLIPDSIYVHFTGIREDVTATKPQVLFRNGKNICTNSPYMYTLQGVRIHRDRQTKGMYILPDRRFIYIKETKKSTW